MTTAEIIIRVLWGLVNINFALASLYFFLRGYSTHYILTRFWRRIPATLIRYENSRAASFHYKWQGNEYTGVNPGTFLLNKKTNVHIFIRPSTMESKYDFWQKNGKGMIALGGVLLGISVILFYFLADPIYQIEFFQHLHHHAPEDLNPNTPVLNPSDAATPASELPASPTPSVPTMETPAPSASDIASPAATPSVASSN